MYKMYINLVDPAKSQLELAPICHFNPQETTGSPGAGNSRRRGRHFIPAQAPADFLFWPGVWPGII